MIRRKLIQAFVQHNPFRWLLALWLSVLGLVTFAQPVGSVEMMSNLGLQPQDFSLLAMTGVLLLVFWRDVYSGFVASLVHLFYIYLTIAWMIQAWPNVSWTPISAYVMIYLSILPMLILWNISDANRRTA